ncbi:SUN-domain-containing protein [Ophiobolus disseminans]|uniref:SUN-domain-containing protein n=1 Tax=Ophiobolus disseminans TaxID=1469910 RepID=A0A6A6ZPE3_9PLEO|nr:SUN-domain-containing protein [Ophiobolus disseminans]
MKISHIATIAALVSASAAKPHHYVHRHAHGAAKRDARADNVVYAPAAVETIIKYVLDGHDVSAEEVRIGLLNGTLEWGSDGNLSTSAKIAAVALATPAPSPSPQPAEKPKSDVKPAAVVEKPENKPEDKPAEEQVEKSAEKPVEKPTAKADVKPAPESKHGEVDTTLRTAAQLVDKDGHCASCDIEFPNGQVPCSEFPYGYGAMPIQHEGLGGWSGIQDPGYRGGDGYGDIRTVVSGSCNDGSCCSPGTFCSYGCANPYLKLSFPKKQGITGQSVGGLYCNDKGMLEMADGSIGKTLCGPSSKSMTVKVQNKLKKSVSICRTDYPGTESMTFPLTLGPGETGYLASPDQDKYYFWQGKRTSAQYYVNSQGVPESEACTWAKPGDARGNWSPTILGTSFDKTEGFTGLFQNPERKDVAINYSITFTGDGVISPCRYKKSTDQYCQDQECWKREDEPLRGCTAAVKKDSTLTVVLSDD